MPYSDPIKQREAQARLSRSYYDRHNAWKKKRRDENTEFVRSYKAERGCMYCEEREPVALDLHHRESENKIHEISRRANSTPSRKKLLEEMEKCDVVCANCHRKLHAGIHLFTRGSSVIPAKEN